MTRSLGRMMRLTPVVMALGIVACSQQQDQAGGTAAQPVEKTFTLTANSAAMKVDFLVGELQGLTITERIDPKTGAVVDSPELRGTLKLKNTSTDQSARLVGGKLLFVDTKGQVIPIAKDDRSDTSFTFNGYEAQRLDPGQETSQAITVPFPKAGLQANDLQTVRLNLTYLPSPYREQTADYAVSLKG